MGSVFWPSGNLPEGMRRWLPLWGPTAGATHLATVLSSDVTLIVCHWSGRLLPCPGPERCPYCLTGRDIQVTGFVPAVVGSPVNDHCVLRLTPYAADELLAVRAAHEGNLRGVRLKLWRRGPGQKARLRVTADGTDDRRALPAAWDVRPHLRHHWGLVEHYKFIENAQEWAERIAVELSGERLDEGGEA